jgi:hypothetical protein
VEAQPATDEGATNGRRHPDDPGHRKRDQPRLRIGPISGTTRIPQSAAQLLFSVVY